MKETKKGDTGAAPPAEKPLNILRLTAENVKKLKAVELYPDGETVVVGGENGAGKSTVLDSILYALGGKEVQPPEPLRRGAQKGMVEVDLGELIVRRTFTPGGGGSLTVRNRDGATYPSPQAILDKLVGDVGFDALAFTRMSAKEQLTMLRKLTGIDFTELDARRAEEFEGRTQAGRELHAAQAVFAGMPEDPEAPREEVSVAALVAELDACGKAEEAARSAQRTAAEAADRLAARKDLVLAGERQLAELEARLATLRRECEEKEAAVPHLREVAATAMDAVPDREAIQGRLAGAEDLNRRVRAARERAAAGQKVLALSARVANRTAEIEAIDAEKAALLAAAPFPVPGLGFGEDGVLLNGLPFEQASSTEQLMVSLAMGAALNPRLRVLLIRDASLLTPANRAVLLDWCREANMQGWVELAGEGPECSVIIEDGSVRGAAEGEEP